jgi:hypothetical protein
MFMRQILDYILKNKEWIFSGVGVPLLLGSFGLLVKQLFSRKPPNVVKQSATSVPPPHDAKTPNGEDIPVSEGWQAILPPGSRYAFKQETRDWFPLGSQSFSFEYAPRGHANPLILKSKIVRAEIQFKCRITNVVKAGFAANDFALNILQPKFLIEARNILERYSISKLRANREEVSRQIVAALSPEFEALGVQLESVSLGALERIG